MPKGIFTVKNACTPTSVSLSAEVTVLNSLICSSVTQKKDIKKQKARLDALKKEAAEERLRAQAEARERVLKEFERGQLGLGLGGSSVISTPGSSKESGSEKLDKNDAHEECTCGLRIAECDTDGSCQLGGLNANMM